jgi:hypothetical protein
MAQGYLDQWLMIKDILTGLTLLAGGACALHVTSIHFLLLTAPIAMGLYCMAVANLAQVTWDVPHAVIWPLWQMKLLSWMGMGCRHKSLFSARMHAHTRTHHIHCWLFPKIWPTNLLFQFDSFLCVDGKAWCVLWAAWKQWW